jgi:hypothetical protein
VQQYLRNTGPQVTNFNSYLVIGIFVGKSLDEAKTVRKDKINKKHNKLGGQHTTVNNVTLEMNIKRNLTLSLHFPKYMDKIKKVNYNTQNLELYTIYTVFCIIHD